MSSSCSLGVRAFRSSFQVAAQQLGRPCNHPRFGAISPAQRCFSLLSSSAKQPPRSPCSPATLLHGRRTLPSRAARSPVLARTFYRPPNNPKAVVITSYIDLPEDYQDEVGLAFRVHDLEADDIVALFGPYMSVHAGNKLLRILHGRRVAGSLEDPAVHENSAMYSKTEIKIALDYLRRTIPVDEVTNAGLRAEDELAWLAMQKDGYRYEDEKGPPLYTFKQLLRGETEQKGVIERVREANEAKRRQELERRKAEEEERMKQEQFGVPGELQTVDEQGQRAVGKLRRPPPSAAMQKWLEKGTSKLERPPVMTRTERILPSALFVLIVTGLLVGYATYYRPLKRSERLWPDVPPAAATVGSIIAANMVVWMAWRFPPLWSMLNKYFLVVPATPRVLSIVGSMFSHQKFGHMAANMALLWLVGTHFHDEVGRGDFLATYLASGSIGFLGSLTSIVLRQHLHLTTLGASGGVYGVMGAYFWMHRFEGFKLFELPPEPYNGVPGLAFIGLLIGINIAGVFSLKHKIDVVSHLTALAAGMAAGRAIEHQKASRRRQREEKTKGAGQGGDATVSAKAVGSK